MAVVIPPGGSFVSGGAVVPTNEELNAVIHALMMGRADIMKNHGVAYGPTMTMDSLDKLIAAYEELRDLRNALKI